MARNQVISYQPEGEPVDVSSPGTTIPMQDGQMPMMPPADPKLMKKKGAKRGKGKSKECKGVK